MSAIPSVIVAGYGQMGHVMEHLLRDRAALYLWPIAPNALAPPAEILAATGSATYLLVCVPTHAHLAVLEPIASRLPSGAALLSIAKGLDAAGACAAEILAAYAGARPWGVLGGPMIANEILAGRIAFAELGTADTALFRRVHELYPASRLLLRHAANPRAVSWCGVLKNVYAPLIGISDELGWGDNARGHLVMGALREMRALLAEFAGANTDVYGDAGLADFVTTVTSASSHHHALGRRLARGNFDELECEGMHSLRALQRRGYRPNNHPLYAAMTRAVSDPGSVVAAVHDWLRSPPP